MALTLASAADLLKEHHLLREIIQGDVWTDDPARIASADEPFAGITYDTRNVQLDKPRIRTQRRSGKTRI